MLLKKYFNINFYEMYIIIKPAISIVEWNYMVFILCFIFPHQAFSELIDENVIQVYEESEYVLQGKVLQPIIESSNNTAINPVANVNRVEIEPIKVYKRKGISKEDSINNKIEKVNVKLKNKGKPEFLSQGDNVLFLLKPDLDGAWVLSSENYALFKINPKGNVIFYDRAIVGIFNKRIILELPTDKPMIKKVENQLNKEILEETKDDLEYDRKIYGHMKPITVEEFIDLIK